MADSATLRVQRHRRHIAGDHSACRPGRCPAAGRVVVADSSPEAAGALDPVVELRRSALRLVAVCEQDPGNVAAAKELRAHLAVIPRSAAADPFDALCRDRFGWQPGSDPDMRDLALSMFESDLMVVLRRMVDEVP